MALPRKTGYRGGWNLSGACLAETITQLAGTPTGEWLALWLALVSALAHAVFGAINKSGTDPFINRGAINIAYSAMAAPFALFVFPLPTAELVPLLAAVFFVHVLYEWLQAASFHLGAFTVVYPISRGTGPLVTAVFAIFVFAEQLARLQWFGLLMLSGGILALAIANIAGQRKGGVGRSKLSFAIMVAVATGLMIAVYTTLDAYGIRQAANPFTFLAWFFFMGGFGFPVLAMIRWRALVQRPPMAGLVVRGFFGAIIAFISFGAVMLATRLGSVSQAAALRETSIIFATLIGVFLFREPIDIRRVAIILVIAAGAVLVELG